MEQVQKPNRVAYYDHLRLAAMAGVVLIHVCAILATDLAADGQTPGFVWHLANLLDAASRFAVPIYFMLTGALLLGDDRSLSPREVGRHRVVRVAVPLAVWTGVYLVFRAIWQIFLQTVWPSILRPEDDFILAKAIRSLFSQPAAVHLWYLYALLIIYVLLPFLRLIVKHAPRRLLVYGLGIWFLFSSLWRAAAGLFPELSLQNYANPDFLGGYLGYVLLGWVLATTEKVPRRRWLVIGYVASVLITTVATYFMTLGAGELNGVFYQYFMPNIVLMAACVFLFCRASDAGKTSSPLVVSLASLSFGVYLIHELFVLMLTPVMRWLPPIVSLIFAPVLVLVLSLILAVVLRKTKATRFLFLGGR